MRVLPLVFVLCLSTVAAALKDEENGGIDASGGKRTKKSYEAKQSFKKERKLARREERAKDKKAKLSMMNRQKKQGGKSSKKSMSISPEAKAAAQEKIEFLKMAVDSSTSKVISLRPDSYREYVNDGPRMHWSLVVFTARGGRYRCSMCQTVHPHVVRVAKSLNYSASVPTFMMEVDVAKNEEIFNEIKLTHAPVFIMVPPTPKSKKPKIKTLYNKLPAKYRLGAHQNIGVDDLTKFIKRHAKQEVHLIEEIDYSNFIGLMMVAGAVAAGLYYRGDKLFKLREYKLPYFAVASVIFIWLMGGGMYNIIRGTAFMGEGLFHPSNGTQYIAGGLIVGLLNFGVGAVVILMNTWALKDPNDPSLLKKRARKGARTPLQMLKELKPSPGLCLIGVIVLWYNLVMIYTRKNPSYRLGFVRP